MRLALILLPALSVVAAGGQEMLLHPVWKTGQRHFLQWHSTGSSSMQAGSQTITREHDITWRYEVDTLPAEAPFHTLRTTFRRVHGRVVLMGREANFDSADPALADPAFTGLAGRTFSARCRADGTVVEVDGMNAWAGGVGGKIDVMGFKQMIESTATRFPVDTVAPGASWQGVQVLDLAQLGQWTATTTFAFEAVENIDGRAQAVVRFTTAIKGGLKPEKAGHRVTLAEDCRQEGLFHFDPASERITFQETTTTLQGTITVPGGEAQPFSSRQTTTLRLLSQEPLPETPAPDPASSPAPPVPPDKDTSAGER